MAIKSQWVVTNIDLGKLIRLERKRNKVSQWALSLELDINQSQVSKMENGTLSIDIHQWGLIAWLLSIPRTIINNEAKFNSRMMELKNG